LKPFGARIIGKPQAPPSKNKDHRNTLRPEVLAYFKRLAEGTGLAYQKFISLYVLDCAKKRKKTFRNVPASRELSAAGDRRIRSVNPSRFELMCNEMWVSERARSRT
jgi:hypothetical protein